MTQSTPKVSPTKTNPFTGYPPLLPMIVIAIVLVSAAQFPSTEALAAAFAWLIFVAILMADGIDAFHNISNIMAGHPSLGTNPPDTTNPSPPRVGTKPA